MKKKELVVSVIGPAGNLEALYLIFGMINLKSGNFKDY